MTHPEIMQKQKPARKCNAFDLFQVKEGLQCGNCLAVTRDNGQTWGEAK